MANSIALITFLTQRTPENPAFIDPVKVEAIGLGYFLRSTK
jgi:hypothetical protein